MEKISLFLKRFAVFLPAFLAVSANAALVSQAEAPKNPPASSPLNPSVFALELQYSPDAFRHDLLPFQQGVTSHGVILEMLYQPEFLRKFGTLGFGPSLGLYPTTGTVDPENAMAMSEVGESVVGSPGDLYHYGAKIQYQFEYLQDQWVIPHASLNAYRFSYRFMNNATGAFMLSGWSLGVHLPLNRIDPRARFQMREGFSVQRTSLIAEAKNMSGSDGVVDASGPSIYVGLKLEW